MIRKLIFFLLSVTTLFSSLHAEVSVKANMDSVNLLMGNVSTLHIELVKPQDQKGEIPLLNFREANNGYVGLCGDSVELSSNIKIDTLNLGSGMIQINYAIPVQAFDSGTYRLPSFVYVSGNDSIRSNHVTFNVVPVNVTAEDPISGYAGVAEPEGKRFYDFIPDWILDFWWIFIILAVLIILSLWGMTRYRKTGVILPSKPMPTPNEKAMSALMTLKERKLWEKGMEKEYFTDLTDILRTYLFERFGINAMEMTTRQILSQLNESDIKHKKDYINQILKVADFVKFAKVRPLPADNIASFDNAVKFVEETSPQALYETESDNKSESGLKGGERQ